VKSSNHASKVEIIASGIRLSRQKRFTLLVWMVYHVQMHDELIKKIRADFARLGGKARAKALTVKQRKAIATKASKAAAKARTLKAKKRKD
jgi:hypothetical protein